MGVPKFYRWVSERYPCLSEVVKEFQIPEFDNLYLDMNGIVHVCSHPEDDNPHFRITEEKIFSDIMYYIEFLFRMIKPRKVFFMAVDGVAPRAKMNQQRGRRFRSAREAEELEKRAMQKGETLPTEKRFDSNCITPGTPFMVRLQEQLKYFVVKKISQDPLWQGVRVYLSGHETPGEGEHKVMDFIRAERASPDYDHNTRHCLYGLDADLMMLGLATHEPHFSLLREEVRFGGRKKDKRLESKRPVTPEETTFHLLHLSLFREYLDFEFSDLRERLVTFEYDLEAIIDDWVLMGFLVGNDFIPHLPNLHINHDALPLLWRTYIEILPSCGGYINTGGRLNLERFEIYLTALSKFDFDTFSEQVGDLKWLESKKGQASAEKAELLSAARKMGKSQKKTAAKMANQFAALDKLNDDTIDDEELGTELIPAFGEDSEDYSEDFSEEDTLDDEFRHHKRNYYMTKMEYEKVTPEVLRDQAEGYVRGIQWILLYYYEGVPSWSWFYQHHYAPYMSDVKDFKNMNITFDKGTPFMPFEQLMAVLPAASKELLPPPYQSLMINETSPVIDFYPQKFDTDQNGKLQEWEAVVLIPFIAENRLLEAIHSVQHLLTNEEKSRNTHGPHLLYEWTPELGEPYTSSLREHFPDIVLNHSRLTEVHKDAFQINSSLLRKGVLSGAKLDVFFPGFPTLKHIPHRAELRKEGVKVFQQASRGYNVTLHIKTDEIPADVEQVQKEYLGKEIYVAWPHLFEAKVVAVCDDSVSYSLEEVKGKGSNTAPRVTRKESDDNTASVWHKEVEGIKDRYKDRLGIMIGETDIILRALPMTGRKYIFASHGRVTMEKQFGTRPVPFALQATVKDIAVNDPDFSQFKTLKEYLPDGSQVYMLGWPHYGCQGEVLDTDLQAGRVRIMLSILEEPDLNSIINNQEQFNIQYHPAWVVAQKIGISGHLLSRLIGNVFVYAGDAEVAREQQNPHKVNVGLNLKFTKSQLEVPGFTKLVDGQWSYAFSCGDLLREYMKKFPHMVENISKSDKRANDNYYESEVIPKDCGYTLKTIEEYIKSLPCSSIKAVKAGADIMSEGVIQALQAETDKIVEKNKKTQKRVKMQVKPHLLYRPIVTSGSLIPDSSTQYQLFDRVVNTRQGFSVPFGLRGTIVGIHPADVEVNTMYEVLFDEDFVGGINIRSSSNRGYRMPPSALLNLVHGQRKNGAAKPITPAQTKSATQCQGHKNQSNAHGNQAGRQPGYNQGQGQSNQGQYGLYQRNSGGNNSGYHDNRTGQDAWSNNVWDKQIKNQGQHGNQQQQGQYGNQQQQGQYGNQQQQQYYNNRQHQQHQGKYGARQEPPYKTEPNVFNGAHSGNKQPKFVTPKVSQQSSSRRLSQGEAQASKPSNTEFENTWKQLQASFSTGAPPSGSSTNEGTSLSQAAAVLPRVSSPVRTENNENKNNNTVNTPTKIDVQSLFSQANHVASASDTHNKKPGTESSGGGPQKPKKTVSRVVSNDEFAAMFKSLEEVQISEEDKKDQSKEEEDSSIVIKKMLNIADSSEEMTKAAPSSEETMAPSSAGTEGGKSYGRQLSVQELFDGAKSQQQMKPTDNKNQQQQNQQQHQQQDQNMKGQNQAKQKGQGQSYNQGQGYIQGQHQNYQQQRNPTGRPALLIPPSRGGNRNPVMELMSFCQSLQMGLPMYDYNEKNGTHYCIVSLFSGPRFEGGLCKSKEEAAESAASVALLQLRGSMQQMAAQPMTHMTGYAAPGVQPQGRQFSSPNSAFSPVTNFPGFFPPQPLPGNGQGYQQGYQQQRPFYGGQGHQQYSRGQNRQPYNQQQAPPTSQQNYQSQQYGRSQQQQVKPKERAITNQSTDNRNEDKPLAINQKQSKEGKTQPTCVVTPFVPLQVTRKQTPQKNRKESVSDENSSKPEVVKSPRQNAPPFSDSSKGDNLISESLDRGSNTSVVTEQCKSESYSKDSGASLLVNSTTPHKDIPPSKEKTAPPKSASGSAKKPRRRIAANFNM